MDEINSDIRMKKFTYMFWKIMSCECGGANDWENVTKGNQINTHKICNSSVVQIRLVNLKNSIDKNE